MSRPNNAFSRFPALPPVQTLIDDHINAISKHVACGHVCSQPGCGRTDANAIAEVQMNGPQVTLIGVWCTYHKANAGSLS